jgi:hypothetical protein
MSAGTAQLLRYGRTGSVSEAGVSYEAIFQVITTDKADGPGIVVLATGIPRYGDIYSVGNEVDTGITAKSIVPTQDRELPIKWEVRVVYSAEIDDPDIVNQPNPTLRPAVVRWLSEEATEPREKDAQGTLIATVNGEVFKPLSERTFFRPVVHIEKNFLVFNDLLQFNYLDSVNSDTWLGGTARTWRCRMLQVDPMFEANIRYKRVFAEMVYKHDEWTLEKLHEGFKYRFSTGSTSLRETPGRKVPYFLDAEGLRASTPSYLEFFMHREQPFNALGLV